MTLACEGTFVPSHEPSHPRSHAPRLAGAVTSPGCCFPCREPCHPWCEPPHKTHATMGDQQALVDQALAVLAAAQDAAGHSSRSLAAQLQDQARPCPACLS